MRVGFFFIRIKVQEVQNVFFLFVFPLDLNRLLTVTIQIFQIMQRFFFLVLFCFLTA